MKCTWFMKITLNELLKRYKNKCLIVENTSNAFINSRSLWIFFPKHYQKSFRRVPQSYPLWRWLNLTSFSKDNTCIPFLGDELIPSLINNIFRDWYGSDYEIFRLKICYLQVYEWVHSSKRNSNIIISVNLSILFYSHHTTHNILIQLVCLKSLLDLTSINCLICKLTNI